MVNGFWSVVTFGVVKRMFRGVVEYFFIEFYFSFMYEKLLSKSSILKLSENEINFI